MKVLANDGLSKSGIEKLERAGFAVCTTKVAQGRLTGFLNKNEIQVLLVRSATQVRKELIDSVPSLRVIGRGGVGMDNIDVAYAKRKGIHVISTPAAASISVAELVFAHLFGMVRFLYDSNRNMPLSGDSKFGALKKNYAGGRELRGKTLGVIGFGRIGKEVAKIALGLGMRVVASAPGSKGESKLDVRFCDGQSLRFTVELKPLAVLLAESDWTTLHVPAQSEPLIGARELQLMKDQAGLVNASRGGIVDEAALIAALTSGKIAYAALDVFKDEPRPSIELLMNPHLSLSPHIGAATVEAQERIGVELADQITDIYARENAAT
ncbi:MAG: D-2-hydroxyacid dehydrogenase [Flavobacteriales bacterium]